jgi:DNA-binding transcriptional regulator WhiA
MATNKLSKSEAVKELWRRGELSWKLDSVQKQMHRLFYNGGHKTNTWLLARRSGKCLTKDTLVMTPQGAKPIQDIKKGELVYGYNYDGTLSLTPVIDVVYSGIKKVRNLINSNRVLAGSTDEHKWLWRDYKGDVSQQRLGDANLKTNKLVRYFIDAPMGSKHVKDAYAIGALLGDGCSKQNHNGHQLYISSQDERIPNHLAEILNCNVLRGHEDNYTWTLTTRPEQGKRRPHSTTSVVCSFYDDWCRNRYAHEKIIDLEEIKTWDRASLLALLAGLIDTDGSVRYSDNRLNLSISMQARPVLEAVKWIFLNLFQYRAEITADNREKYKNGPVYEVSISSNLFSKRALRELDKFIVTPRKKWNPEYEALPERNNVEDYVGVKLGEYYEEECYDLALENESHMYATVDGLITHNTFLLCVLALEQCIKVPNSIVKFVSPTKLQVNNNVRPIFKTLLQDCPDDVKPEFKTKDYIYYFPNGSEIQLAGTDNQHAEKLRGGDSHICIVDEAGSCDGLDNIVKSILLPTTLITRGKIILASTPPSESEHDFLKFIEEAELKGSLVKKTVYDNPRITKDQLDELINELGGLQTDAAKRELLCEIIKDGSTSVIPEATDELYKEIVMEWPRPPFFDSYVAMDLGFHDLTAVLFGYYDFKSARLIVERELILNGQDLHLDKLTESIKSIESELWTNPLTQEVKSPLKRVSDIDYIVFNEIKRISGGAVTFEAAKKDNNEAAINSLRAMLAKRQIIIHPRCTTLLRHLKNVRWKSVNNKEKFARSPDDGHYDAVDALKYMIRALNVTKNPYPHHYVPGPDAPFVEQYLYANSPKHNGSESKMDIYKAIFGIKKR